MIKRVLTVLGIAVAGALGVASSANALGVGLGVSAVPVPTPVPPAVSTLVGGAGDAVGGTLAPVNAPSTDDPVFAGPRDVPNDGVSVANYQAFEDLVNDVAEGGGLLAPVISTDAFSAEGVDGGVAGVPTFAPARLLK